jgi:hypothetical protein
VGQEQDCLEDSRAWSGYRKDVFCCTRIWQTLLSEIAFDHSERSVVCDGQNQLTYYVFKGATSYENLCTVNNVVCETFKSACQCRGLLDDDNEWIQCLQDASHMCTGHRMRNLFAIILTHCNPTSPDDLWNRFKDNLCDDLHHRLTRLPFNIPNPSKEEVHDYGLYLIDCVLRKNGKSLNAFPPMPVSQMAARWGEMEGNLLIAEQLQYNRVELQQTVDEGVPSLNAEQRVVFDAVVNDAMSRDEHRPGHAYFVHYTGMP